jgi:hypothetical protein
MILYSMIEVCATERRGVEIRYAGLFIYPAKLS